MKIVRLFLLTTLLTAIGCVTRSVDSRLEDADSLLSTKDNINDFSGIGCADSLLKAIDVTALSERDRALYALLTVEAHYKNFEPLTADDDSLAKAAVQFFDGKNEAVYASRAQVMKGAVAEEMGDFESAVGWYAKGATTSDDVRQRAYAHFRLGTLYDVNQLSERRHIVSHYREAERLFGEVGDTVKLTRCAFNLAHVYSPEMPDSVRYYLDRCWKLADQSRDTAMIVEALCGLSALSANEGEGNRAVEYARKGVEYAGEGNAAAMLALADAYATIGDVLNAKRAYSSINDVGDLTDVDMVVRQHIAAASGDYREAYFTLGRRFDTNDSIYNSETQRTLLRAELANDLYRAEAEKNALMGQRQKWMWLLFALIVLAGVALAVALRLRRKRNALSVRVEELRRDLMVLVDEKASLLGKTQTLREENATLQEQNDSLLNQNERLNSDVERHLRSFMSLAVNVSDVKDIDRMAAKLREALKGVVDDDYCCSVVALADKKYPGLIASMRKAMDERGVEFAKKEMLLVALTVVGCSPYMISVLMGYKNYRYVYNVKSGIARRIGYATIEDIVSDYVSGKAAFVGTFDDE